MNRRAFFGTLITGLAAAAAGRSASRRRRAVRRPASPLDRVGVSSRSFDDYFDAAPDSAVKSPSERLVLLDFPQMVADRYKVHNLEVAATHFASLEPAYLDALKSGVVAAQSRLINIGVNATALANGGGLSDPDATIRNAALETSQQWIDIARQLRARSVCCDPGGLNPDDLNLTIDSCRKLAAYGRAKGVTVLLETPGETGAAHPEALVQVIRAVGGNSLGALPDLGSFPDEAARRRGLPLLFQYARTLCHATGPKLDAQNGQPDFDFQGCVGIARDARFTGVYSVEFESGGDAYAGVQGVIDELLRFL